MDTFVFFLLLGESGIPDLKMRYDCFYARTQGFAGLSKLQKQKNTLLCSVHSQNRFYFCPQK